MKVLSGSQLMAIWKVDKTIFGKGFNIIYQIKIRDHVIRGTDINNP